YDEIIGTLILTSLVTLGSNAPRSNRVLTTGTAFTTTMRVINRVHGSTTNGRTDATPACCTRFTQYTQSVFRVTYFTDGCAAVGQHFTHLARAQTQGAVHTFTSYNLSGSTG